MKDYGILIIRIFLGIVFLYFGVSQILYPEKWIDFLPEFLANIIPNMNDIFKSRIILLNGLFDCLIGLFFMVGFWLKFVSILAFLHLIGIFIFSLGFTPSGMRDLGLAGASLSLFFLGNDRFSLNHLLNK